MKLNQTFQRHMHMLSLIKRWQSRTSALDLMKRLRASGFDVDLRTVQRDLNKLSKDYPLYSDSGKPQGWCWQKDAPQLEFPAMEPEQALVFHLAEKYLRPVLPTTTLNSLSPWFGRANVILEEQGKGLADWRKKVRVLAPGQPLQPPTVNVGVQEQITQGLLQNKRISVKYRPRNQKGIKEYVVNPLGLVVRDQTIYLVCTLWDYPDIKQLLLNRIREAILIDEPAKVLKGFDLDNYIAKGEFGLPSVSGKKLNLVADFSRGAAVFIIERPVEKKQKIEELNEQTVRLTTTLLDTLELRRWLLGFGADVEIVAPAELRADFAKIYGELTRRYKASNES